MVVKLKKVLNVLLKPFDFVSTLCWLGTFAFIFALNDGGYPSEHVVFMGFGSIITSVFATAAEFGLWFSKWMDQRRESRLNGTK